MTGYLVDIKNEKFTQNEVRDPRQVLARRTWVADRGVPCDQAYSLDKFSVAPLRLAHTEIWSVLCGPYLNWVCSVWPIPKHWSVSSGPYPVFGLFDLTNTQTSVCFVWSTPNLRYVRSGEYPNIGLFRLVHIQSSVCFGWPIPNCRSVSTGPCPGFGLFGLVHTQSSVSFW